MTALVSLDLTPAADAYSPRIADAWRISSQEVGEAIRVVRQSLKVITEADEMLLPNVPVHRPAFVEQCRKRLPWELSLYLEHVRRISETEAEMEARGMAFARSSYAWGA
ncbi:hypothetical protein [Mesorhizobium sp.]|uniref:hypothetical protein n=1 Tax=Mesorhizobium sp. TaxID=1871066 RepID=UPI000FE54793|nr:hypothetical protein [Mesorhizobium sp.]RWK12165.1 MAG: hypothetical protein EOR39_05125 [Mesorhizobium sp.]